METPEEQVEKAKKAKEELDVRTTNIPLTKKQLDIINGIATEKQIYAERLESARKREADLVTFILEHHQINDEDIEKLSMEKDKIVIVIKAKELKDNKEDKDTKLSSNGESKLEKVV